MRDTDAGPAGVAYGTLFFDHSGDDQHEMEVFVAEQRQQELQNHVDGSTTAEEEAIRTAIRALCGNTPTDQVL